MKNPYLNVDKKIVSEIYTSSEPMDNLEVLCDVYGSRWPGTQDDYDSSNFMVEKLKSYGIENAHTETFEIPGWRRGAATLEVTHPIKKSFDVISLPFSVGGEVEADVIFLNAGHVDVYEKRKDEVEGNIVMVTSARPAGMTRNLHRSEKYVRSVLAGAKGWIFMNHYPAYGPPTGGISPIIPSVGISYEDGSFLTRLLKREGEVRARIKTTDENLTVETRNVVCDVEGDSVDDEYVLTGCHVDGHDISQGAVDPASGAVVVMEMARVLNMVKDSLKRRIRFVGFGAEETGLFGSYYYASAHESELDNCRFMLNLDSGGGAGKKGVIFNDFPELEPTLEKWAAEMKVDMPHGQMVSPYSDHWPFFKKGVPTGSGSDPTARASRTGRGYGHTRYDTLDKVEQPNVRLSSANYARFLLRVANADDWAPRRKSQKEIEDFIKQMGFDETVKLAERVKAYVITWDQIHPDTEKWLNRKSDW
jgi:Zn-dependent M28 family amino/carboxypeptidase